MARDELIVAGSVAFAASVGIAEAALARQEGMQDVHFIPSGHQCTEHPDLPRYLVEVHGEWDAMKAKEWMDRIEVALTAAFPIHRCVG